MGKALLLMYTSVSLAGLFSELMPAGYSRLCCACNIAPLVDLGQSGQACAWHGHAAVGMHAQEASQQPEQSHRQVSQQCLALV